MSFENRTPSRWVDIPGVGSILNDTMGALCRAVKSEIDSAAMVGYDNKGRRIVIKAEGLEKSAFEKLFERVKDPSFYDAYDCSVIRMTETGSEIEVRDSQKRNERRLEQQKICSKGLERALFGPSGLLV